MFQRSYEFDERDIALGMNNVYLERNGQGSSAYGGIRRLELKRDRALLQVEGETAKRVGEEELQIHFRLDDEEFAQLRRGLRLVFDGFDCFVDVAV
jgi:hypothetical protein